MATSNLICEWVWPFRPATPTSRPNPTRSEHPISTTSADANEISARVTPGRHCALLID